MKTKISVIVPLAIGLITRVASGQSTLDEGYMPGLTVTGGDPVGVVDREAFDDAQAGDTVADMTVNLQLLGGYNGDLYVSLIAPDGTSAVLLDEPGAGVNGFGASGAGMNITLSDDSANAIQNETSAIPLTNTYQPADLLTVFQGAPAAGTWVLYCANLGMGDGPTTLVSWGMDITVLPAPEPSASELGALSVLVMIAARYRPSSPLKKCKV